MAVAKSILISCAAIVCSICLQGCNIAVPRHQTGNWQAKVNYLTNYQYSPPGQRAGKAILNSCSNASISAALVCGGHGLCKDWNDLMLGQSPGFRRLSFCSCNTYWADPECRTPRKSQVTAFVLSLFLGMFGIDELYLGFPAKFFFKLITLGGGGVWYLYDLCRIGSYPVDTSSHFLVADDLPHFAFVLTVVTAMITLGFAAAMYSLRNQRTMKAHELLLLRMDTENHESGEPPREMAEKPTISDLHVSARTSTLAPTSRSLASPPSMPLRQQEFSGYGATLPGSANQMPMASRSFRAAATLPPVTTATMSPTMRPVMTGSVARTLPPMASMPLTQNTLPRAVPMNTASMVFNNAPVAVSSPMLPVVQGMQPVSPRTLTAYPQGRSIAY